MTENQTEQARVLEAQAPGLSARDIHFAYGTKKILRGVDFEVELGEIVGILGPNGTGKSTLLGVLTGDLAAAQGTVEMHGRELGDYSRIDLARSRSVMPQANEFPFSYLVHDVVMMGRAPWGTSEAENEIIVDAAMERTQVEHMQDREITQLSGGEAARVTLARVVAQDSRVIFLDEPTAALDIAHQERTMQLCMEMARGGDAVIAVMHDIQLAAAYCDRIVLMKDGLVAASGAPEQVLTSEILSAVYDWPIEVVKLASGQLAIVPSRR